MALDNTFYHCETLKKMFLCSFFQAIPATTWGVSWNTVPFLHDSTQISEGRNHGHKYPSCCPFTDSIASFLPSHLFNHSKHSSVLHSCNVVILRMLCRWNYTACNLFGFFFFLLSIIRWRSIQLVCSNSLFLLIAE